MRCECHAESVGVPIVPTIYLVGGVSLTVCSSARLTCDRSLLVELLARVPEMVAVVSRLVLLLLCSLVHSAVGQCPLRTRVTPRQLRLEIGESVLFQCLDDSSDAAVGAARFFKDGAAITIDGSKYTRPLGHGLNVANVDLTDEGEYTCLPEDNSCSSDTVEGYLLGESGTQAHFRRT